MIANAPPSNRCPRCGNELPLDKASGVCPACAFGEVQAAPADDSGAEKLSLDDIPLPGKPHVAPKKSGTIKLGHADFQHSGIRNKPGDRIGRYKLLEEIGEGGFGVVFVAEQEQPVRRRVALKVIKLGMDTREVIARFEAERQALAMMNHPNIAKVLDAGATDTGQPYFVMELVKGVPITEYCDRNNLGTNERLGLFTQVCHAIQHAHQKGIIHRDIKPPNILVTLHDGVPVPKVIDFGIAKSTTNVRLTDKTVYTAMNIFMGTPAYMSPEQAELSGLDIDTRSDVYALGVLLYELLTGRTPFDAKRLKKAAVDEIRRIIREEEPPRPSTRISNLTAAEQTETAKRRQVEPPKLLGIIRGDLDWIVMKTLEKDRTRRYDSATGLAADIQRYLINEPIVARAPSQLYRFQKMARRNKLAFGAAAVVSLSLVLGLGVSTILFIREQAARKRANAATGEAIQSKQKLAQKNDEIEGKNKQLSVLLAKVCLSGTEAAFQQDEAAYALALLARGLREAPTNRLLTERLVNALNHRTFLVPAEPPPPAGVRIGADDPELRLLIASSHDGRLVATATNGETIRVWGAASHLVITQFVAHAKVIRSVAFSPDNQTLVTASADETAKLWHARSGQPLTGESIQNPLLHPAAVYQAVFSPDGRTVLTACRDGQVRRWSWQESGAAVSIHTNSRPVNTARFSADGGLIVSSSDEEVRLWSADFAWEAEPRRFEANVLDAEFVGNTSVLRVTLEGGEVRFFVLTQRLFHEAEGDSLSSEALAPAGTMLSWEKLAQLGFTNRPPHNLSPDGGLLAVASEKNVRILDFHSRSNSIPPLLHSGIVNAVRFSPDGRRLGTSASDETVRVWDVATGLPLTDLLPCPGLDPGVSFTTNGSLVVVSTGQAWPVWVASESAPAWLPVLAEAVAGERLADDGSTQPVSALEFFAQRQELWRQPKTNSFIEWGCHLLGLSPATKGR